MKKIIKRIGCLILMFAVSFAMVMALNITAEAKYFYKVKIVIGGTGNEGASFISSMEGGALTIESHSATAYMDIDGNLVIDNLAYNDKITFNPQSAVSIKKTDAEGNELPAKYYVKGMRRSGANDVTAASSFNVTKDDSYVIAYGVGAVIPYTVRYLDGAGNALAEDAVFFAGKGDELYIPHKYIAGYVPNAYNIHCLSLKDGEEFVFTYSKGTEATGGTVYEDSSYTEYSTTQGPSNISFQLVPRANAGVVNNPAAAGQPAADGGAAEQANPADQGEATIQVEEVPLMVEDIEEIEDEEVAKGLQEVDSFAFLMRWAILLIVFGMMVVTITVVATVKEKKDKDRLN